MMMMVRVHQIHNFQIRIPSGTRIFGSGQVRISSGSWHCGSDWIQIQWFLIQLGMDVDRIHQIHCTSGQIRIQIRCTPNDDGGDACMDSSSHSIYVFWILGFVFVSRDYFIFSSFTFHSWIAAQCGQ